MSALLYLEVLADKVIEGVKDLFTDKIEYEDEDGEIVEERKFNPYKTAGTLATTGLALYLWNKYDIGNTDDKGRFLKFDDSDEYDDGNEITEDMVNDPLFNPLERSAEDLANRSDCEHRRDLLESIAIDMGYEDAEEYAEDHDVDLPKCDTVIDMLVDKIFK